ncbi:hypothetical protein [Hydrogenophaga crassostreae]|nr:hypothetical protein [Hydrogenophaga crassostreae]
MHFIATAVRPQTLALALAVLLVSACDPAPADPAATASQPASAVAPAGESEDKGALGSGSLEFHLEPGTTLALPVTFCAGHGTILTVAGREGETQVDLRVIELEAARSGASLEKSTEVGYRFNGTDDQGRKFMELWQTRSIDAVVRDGDNTRVSGKLYGLRSFDKGNGAGTSPEPIDGGTEHAFTLSATCSK